MNNDCIYTLAKSTFPWRKWDKMATHCLLLAWFNGYFHFMKSQCVRILYKRMLLMKYGYKWERKKQRERTTCHRKISFICQLASINEKYWSTLGACKDLRVASTTVQKRHSFFLSGRHCPISKRKKKISFTPHHLPQITFRNLGFGAVYTVFFMSETRFQNLDKSIFHSRTLSRQ